MSISMFRTRHMDVPYPAAPYGPSFERILSLGFRGDARRFVLRRTLGLVSRRSIMKTLTITDHVYRKLLTVKRRDESFSKLFERLVEGAKGVETLRNLRGCVEFTNKNRLPSEIQSMRAERRP